MLKSLKDAAQEINVPYRTLYNRYVRGDIQVEKIGRTLAVDPEYLKARVEQLGIARRRPKGQAQDGRKPESIGREEQKPRKSPRK